jgi:hypothetical protein
LDFLSPRERFFAAGFSKIVREYHYAANRTLGPIFIMRDPSDPWSKSKRNPPKLLPIKTINLKLAVICNDPLKTVAFMHPAVRSRIIRLQVEPVFDWSRPWNEPLPPIERLGLSSLRTLTIGRPKRSTGSKHVYCNGGDCPVEHLLRWIQQWTNEHSSLEEVSTDLYWYSDPDDVDAQPELHTGRVLPRLEVWQYNTIEAHLVRLYLQSSGVAARVDVHHLPV